MVDFKYLFKGLCGLANAHKANTMAGHLGAAVIAGYFWGEDLSELDDEVYRGVEKELDRIIRGEEAFWFDPQKAGLSLPQLFEEFEQQPPQEQLIPKIVQALAANVDKTRQSGHNVIFASIAVRALHDHPDFASPEMVSGIEKLIRGFNGATAGRGYYGKQKGWVAGEKVVLDESTDFPMYKSLQEMVNVVIDQLIQSVDVRRQGFGGMWHVINHAAAITELDRFGYRDIAQQALAAHHQHVRLWNTLPDMRAELGLLKPSQADPREARYWQADLFREQARLTHRIKTLYGFHTIIRFIEDAGKRQQAEQSLRFLMA